MEEIMTNKKILLGLLIGLTLVGSLSAVDWQGYSSPLQENKLFINAGIGFGSTLHGKMSVPPIQVSADYVLPLGGLPFTLGGIFGFSRSKYDTVSYDYTYTGLAFGARLGYHPDFGVDKLDTYATLTLGYYSYKGKADANYAGLPKAPSTYLDYSQFLWGLGGGARYFFTPLIGAYAELGYSALSYVSVGVALKFL
jgi:hypothetical protein